MCVFFRSSLRVPVALPCTGRCSLDINPKETHALAAQLGGRAHLVNISQEDQKGKVEQVYSSSDPELQGANWDFGARFANGGSTLVFGCISGSVLVWDRNTGTIVHALQQGEGASQLPAPRSARGFCIRTIDADE